MSLNDLGPIFEDDYTPVEELSQDTSAETDERTSLAEQPPRKQRVDRRLQRQFQKQKREGDYRQLQFESYNVRHDETHLGPAMPATSAEALRAVAKPSAMHDRTRIGPIPPEQKTHS